MKLHYLAGDGGLERAIVIFRRLLLAIEVGTEMKRSLHGRSGRVALPRVNGTLAGLAIFDMLQRLRRLERAVDERKSVVDILKWWMI